MTAVAPLLFQIRSKLDSVMSLGTDNSNLSKSGRSELEEESPKLHCQYSSINPKTVKVATGGAQCLLICAEPETEAIPDQLRFC